ncbi:MAG: hypothetical protein WKH97_09975 [Casimicrobiaceae bacterium]
MANADSTVTDHSDPYNREPAFDKKVQATVRNTVHALYIIRRLAIAAINEPTADGCGDESWTTKRVRGRICEYIVHYRGQTRDRILRERAPPPVRGKGYDSPAGYAKYTELICECWLSVIRERVSGQAEREAYGATTLMYDKDTVARVIAACDAIEQYLQAGTVGWTKAAGAERKAVEAQRGAVKTAHADQAFAAFLSRSLGQPAQ